MNIILQNYNDLLKKIIFDTFSVNLKKQLDTIDINGNVMNYINLLSNLDESLCLIARESIITIIESLDKSFCFSNARKSKYTVKSHHSRTIMTIFGEITFNRTFYTSKINNNNYCYVDRILGLHKYDYFDPYLKAAIIEQAANNSYPKVAKYINDLIGNRIKIKSSFNYISRQTVRNIIMSAKISNPIIKELPTPVELTIIADEKFIHTQNNDKNDIMIKSIVVFENVKNKRLVNKMSFASYDNSFIDDCLNYINTVYNVDEIKTIFILGDGAKWIKSLKDHFYFHKGIHVIPGLDKFHFKQALHHIAQNINIENILANYILHNEKKNFIKCCDLLIEENNHRSLTIQTKKEYILNNWSNINNLYKYKLSCPMESQISHNIADLFSSRPKGYSINTIAKLMKLRLLYKNNFNLKKLYLNNFNSNTILNINNNEVNYSHFDMFHKKETYTLSSKQAIISTFY